MWIKQYHPSKDTHNQQMREWLTFLGAPPSLTVVANDGEVRWCMLATQMGLQPENFVTSIRRTRALYRPVCTSRLQHEVTSLYTKMYILDLSVVTTGFLRI